MLYSATISRTSADWEDIAGASRTQELRKAKATLPIRPAGHLLSPALRTPGHCLGLSASRLRRVAGRRLVLRASPTEKGPGGHKVLAPCPRVRFSGLGGPEPPHRVTLTFAAVSTVAPIPATEGQAKGRAGIRGHGARHFRPVARAPGALVRRFICTGETSFQDTSTGARMTKEE